jgi:phytoene dehydrogenase-like protein
MFGPALGGDFPLAMALMQLAMQHRQAAGYVIGGALALVEPIEKRYRNLGGEIRFDARVQKVLVQNDRAMGVRLADGTEHRADCGFHCDGAPPSRHAGGQVLTRGWKTA